MKPVNLEVEGCPKVVYGADQPEYLPLPGVEVEPGVTLTRWSLTEAERRAITGGAHIDLFLHHFGQPLQPVRVQVEGVPAEDQI